MLKENSLSAVDLHHLSKEKKGRINSGNIGNGV